jgi:carbonic anhydrase
MSGNLTGDIQGVFTMSFESACCSSRDLPFDRRRLLRSLLAAGGTGTVALLAPGAAWSSSTALTREQRDQLTPDQVLGMLLHGNDRFRTGKMQSHDYLSQKRATAGGQYPAAAILSCIDSRAPAEIVLDTAIGDTFNARIAGNIANDDILGSLEFACAAAGAKLILVMGHTACGAVKGAIDGVELGHLTRLLGDIKPAVAATIHGGDRSSKNAAFVDAVAATNVRQTVNEIPARSSVLAGLQKDGKLRIVGSMYHLVGGRLEVLS